MTASNDGAAATVGITETRTLSGGSGRSPTVASAMGFRRMGEVRCRADRGDSVPRSLAKMINYPRFWMITDTLLPKR